LPAGRADAIFPPFLPTISLAVAQFNSVDGEQYIVMRHIFLQNLGLENDFDFLEFVKESMEEEFASMVGVRATHRRVCGAMHVRNVVLCVVACGVDGARWV
jgi:hypothetical protein